MKNYLNKSTIKGIKSELAEKYGVGKSDEIWKYANSSYRLNKSVLGIGSMYNTGGRLCTWSTSSSL